MPADLTQSIFSPTTLLWLAISLIAAGLLLGATNQRRAKLTGALRGFVDRNQDHESDSKGGDPPGNRND